MVDVEARIHAARLCQIPHEDEAGAEEDDGDGELSHDERVAEIPSAAQLAFTALQGGGDAGAGALEGGCEAGDQAARDGDERSIGEQAPIRPRGELDRKWKRQLDAGRSRRSARG